ncbi:MAG: MMPL family transporter [Bdellovibrio sp.]|nr:MMPL family transporter [Bdellovibrio sp.]
MDALERMFGSDEKVIIGIHLKNGIFTNESIKLLHEITEKLWTMPDIVRVDSLSNYNHSIAKSDDIITTPFLDKGKHYTHAELEERKTIAMDDAILSDRFVDKRGTTFLVVGTLVAEVVRQPDYKNLNRALRDMMGPIESNPLYKNYSFHYAGSGVINDAYRDVSDRDIAVMIPLNILMMALFLYAVFRSWKGILLPIGLVGVTVICTLGISAAVGFEFDNLSAAIPGILIAVCLADSVHLLSTYYRAVRMGQDQKSAMIETIEKNLMATFLTSLTTFLGFISLANTELIPVQKMGILAGTGTMLAWFFTIGGVCPFLYLTSNFKLREKTTLNPQFAYRVVDWIEKHRRSILWISNLSMLLMFYLGIQNRVNSDPLEHFDKRLKVSRDAYFLLDIFNGVGGPQVLIDSGQEDGAKDPAFLAKVEHFITEVDKEPVVNKVSSILDIIKQLNQRLHGDDRAFYRIPDSREQVAEILLMYSMGLPQGMDLNNQISLDGRFIRLEINWSLHDSQRSLKMIAGFEELAKQLGLTLSITGKLTMYHRMTGYIVRTFFYSMLASFIGIGLIMMISMGSWKFGLLSLPPNIVPMAFSIGLMTLLKRPIDIGTSLVISVCFGIAVDDTIHFLIHYRQSMDKGMDIKDAIRDIYVHTAPSLVFTTVILVTCFGAFIFANFIPNVNFGILCAFTLSVALAMDLLYLPALLFTFKLRK